MVTGIEQTRDDIINEEIEQEHSENNSNDDFTSIRHSLSEKNKRFKDEISKDANKRLYQHRISITWAELIEIDKNSLRYEENNADYLYNNNLMKQVSKDYGKEAVNFCEQVQSIPEYCVEEFTYSTRPYNGCNEEKSGSPVHVIEADLSKCQSADEIKDIIENSIKGIIKNAK